MFSASDDRGSDRQLTVTRRLRDRRHELGLTQKQVVTRLARRGIRTTNKTLSSFEHGAGVDVVRLPELAAALECTVTYLLGMTTDPMSWEPDRAGVPVRDVPKPAVAPAGDSSSWILGPDVPQRRLNHR